MATSYTVSCGSARIAFDSITPWLRGLLGSAWTNTFSSPITFAPRPGWVEGGGA